MLATTVQMLGHEHKWQALINLRVALHEANSIVTDARYVLPSWQYITVANTRQALFTAIQYEYMSAMRLIDQELSKPAAQAWLTVQKAA